MSSYDVIVIGSGVNPALTAMANALRVGDHLLGRLDARLPTEAADAA